MLRIKKSIIIDTNNIKDILIKDGLIRSDEDVSFEELSAGVSSVIIKIFRKSEKLILKQALPKFRLKENIYFPLRRNLNEKNFIDLVNTFLEPGTIPVIKMQDTYNYFFVMTCAPDGYVQWNKLLLNGQIDLIIGEKVGKILAKIHNHTAYNKKLLQKFKDRSVFILGRIDICYKEVEKYIPELKEAMDKIISDSLNTRVALCTADFNPKNTLVKDRNVMFMDHEGAHYGDPSFDIGIFLAHLFLKSIHNYNIKNDYFNLIQSIWNSYCNEIFVWEPKYIEKKVTQHISAMMLSRVFGKLPVTYLEERDKNIVKKVTTKSILTSVECITDMMQLISDNLEEEGV